jgi:methylthioribulose-1-phosphate dehydratase
MNSGKFCFSGYEVLKGLPNIKTHDAAVEIPIFENDQDMVRFSTMLKQKQNLLNSNAFLMEKHGLYVWGSSLFEAKRHLEIYEFLLDIELTLKQI